MTGLVQLSLPKTQNARRATPPSAVFRLYSPARAFVNRRSRRSSDVHTVLHLRDVLREYVEYYNESRCHMSLDGDSPRPRRIEDGAGPVVAKPVLGGLHHRYSRAA